MSKKELKELNKTKEKMKDPKSLFANERTFLSWLNSSLKLGAIGTALLTFLYVLYSSCEVMSGEHEPAFIS